MIDYAWAAYSHMWWLHVKLVLVALPSWFTTFIAVASSSDFAAGRCHALTRLVSLVQ